MKNKIKTIISIATAISAIVAFVSLATAIYCSIIASPMFAAVLFIFFISLAISFLGGVAQDYF